MIWITYIFLKLIFQNKSERGREREKDENCDTVIYSKKYIFGLHPHSWHRVPKTWNFLCGKSHNGKRRIFCYA